MFLEPFLEKTEVQTKEYEYASENYPHCRSFESVKNQNCNGRECSERTEHR